jgi:hypothetical protein
MHEGTRGERYTGLVVESPALIGELSGHGTVASVMIPGRAGRSRGMRQITALGGRFYTRRRRRRTHDGSRVVWRVDVAALAAG